MRLTNVYWREVIAGKPSRDWWEYGADTDRDI
jgi:hypothetical protein